MTANFTFRIGETPDGQVVRMDLGMLILTKMLVVANSGAGKSYLGRVIIERTAKKVQWIIFDPEGEYGSLREMHDFLLVGPDGELPVDVRSAGLLARKIMETRLSVIVDLYGMMDIRPAWAASFLNSLLTLPKSLYSPVMVAIDEAHKFAPEILPAAGDKETRLAMQLARHAVCTLTDSGRKQSRGAALMSQRVSKLAADARGDLNNTFVGRMVQDLDRERAADILGQSKRDSLQLRSLPPGTFFAFGPAFLMDGIFQVKIDPCETHHPKAGERRLLEVPPASEAIRHIVEQMADLPQQAQREADELAGLRRRVTELESQLRQRPTQIPLPAEPITKHVFKDGEVDRLEAAVSVIDRAAAQLTTFGARFQDSVKEVSDALHAAAAAQQAPAPGSRTSPTPARRTPIPATPRPPKPAGEVDESLTGPEQRILDAIAWLESASLPDPQQVAVAIIAGYTYGGGAFNNPRGKLHTRGFVEYLADDRIQLTPAGREQANAPEIPLTREELHKRAFSILDGPKQRILQPLINVYPHSLSKVQLAERAGYQLGGAFNNPLGRLRTLGLIDYQTDPKQEGPERNRVVALPVLFLE